MTQMKRFEHGGDIYTHEGVIDYSANLNPLGIPQRVIDALHGCVEHVDVYPDPHCRELVAKIARAEGVGEACVIATAGATDLMTRVCLALKPQAALVTAPCYSGYEQAIEQSGARAVRHALREEDGFSLTERVLDDITGDVDVVFLASPNNPTGLTIDDDLLGEIMLRCSRLGIHLVLDECFIDFTDAQSAVRYVEDCPNLIVMKAFTKIFALAGLRIGFGLTSDTELMARLHEVGQMWAVSTPAQMAALAALDEDGWAQKTRELVAAQRVRLIEALEGCGMRVIVGEANYLLFKSGFDVYEPLLERGILVRRCGNYQGLDDNWFRIAVRTPEENARFIAALQETCS